MQEFLYIRWMIAGLVAVALTGLVASESQASQTDDFRYFRGGGYIIAMTEACAPSLSSERAVYAEVRYRPAGFWNNGPTSYLSITLPGPDVLTFENANGEFDGSFQRVASWVSGVDTFNLRPNAAVRFATVRPANLNENSDFVYIDARIRDFLGIRGCNARIDFAVTQP